MTTRRLMLLAAPVLLAMLVPLQAQPAKPAFPFTHHSDIKWTGTPGRQEQAILYGDPAKPGPYGLLIKWYPGNFSRPHRHSTDRHVYVVSGTWWNSDSEVYDPTKTYPMTAGTSVVHPAGQVHWDGAKDDVVILHMTGIGPVATTSAERP